MTSEGFCVSCGHVGHPYGRCDKKSIILSTHPPTATTPCPCEDTRALGPITIEPYEPEDPDDPMHTCCVCGRVRRSRKMVLAHFNPDNHADWYCDDIRLSCYRKTLEKRVRS